MNYNSNVPNCRDSCLFFKIKNLNISIAQMHTSALGLKNLKKLIKIFRMDNVRIFKICNTLNHEITAYAVELRRIPKTIHHWTKRTQDEISKVTIFRRSMRAYCRKGNKFAKKPSVSRILLYLLATATFKFTLMEYDFKLNTN